jgi:extradiol dioxygenase family protein
MDDQCEVLTHRGYQCQNAADTTVAGVRLCPRHHGFLIVNDWINVSRPRVAADVRTKPTHQLKLEQDDTFKLYAVKRKS